MMVVKCCTCISKLPTCSSSAVLTRQYAATRIFLFSAASPSFGEGMMTVTFRSPARFFAMVSRMRCFSSSRKLLFSPWCRSRSIWAASSFFAIYAALTFMRFFLSMANMPPFRLLVCMALSPPPVWIYGKPMSARAHWRCAGNVGKKNTAHPHMNTDGLCYARRLRHSLYREALVSVPFSLASWPPLLLSWGTVCFPAP